jgi:hypothetical protein
MSCLKHDRFQEKKKCTCGKSRQYSQRGAAEATHALDNDKAGASTGGTAQDLATAAGAAGQSVICCRDNGFMGFKRKAPAPPDAAASLQPGNSLVPYGTVAHDRSARDAHGLASGAAADGTLALVSVPSAPAHAPAHDLAAHDLEHDGGPHIHAANDAAGDARALDSVARSRARAATPEAKAKTLAAKAKKNKSQTVPPIVVEKMYDFVRSTGWRRSRSWRLCSAGRCRRRRPWSARRRRRRRRPRSTRRSTGWRG